MAPDGSPFDRIPTARVIDPIPVTPLQVFRSAWTPRHWFVLAITATALGWLFATQLPSPPNTVGGWVGVVILATLGGLVVVTYVPGSRGRIVPASPCGRAAGVLLPLAFVPIQSGEIMLGIFVLLIALWQRIVGATTCR